MDRLHRIKNRLIDCVESQVENNLECVDTKELGEAIDMIKDISKAMYYFTITEAMDGDSKGEREYYPNAWEVYPIPTGKEIMYGGMMKYKKNYMEGKAMHHDKNKLMQDLENYMEELNKDVTEMMAEMTAEEKQMLQQKLQHLMGKVK